MNPCVYQILSKLMRSIELQYMNMNYAKPQCNTNYNWTVPSELIFVLVIPISQL